MSLSPCPQSVPDDLRRFAEATAAAFWTRKLNRARHVPLEDVRQCAYIGLLEAIRDYDSGRGMTLKAYAWMRMRRSLYDGVSAARGTTAGKWRDAPSERSLVPANEALLRAPLQPRADPLRVRAVQKAMAYLDPREAYIVCMVADGMTIDEAGGDVGLSKSWAARSRQRALRKLRRIVEGV